MERDLKFSCSANCSHLPPLYFYRLILRVYNGLSDLFRSSGGSHFSPDPDSVMVWNFPCFFPGYLDDFDRMVLLSSIYSLSTPDKYDQTSNIFYFMFYCRGNDFVLHYI